MGAVDRYLSEPLLVGESAREFHRNRERVAARHGAWRANFPSIGLLLDTDEDRAQALAGNYATQARETVGVWLSAFEADAATDIEVEDRVEWVEGFWEAWRRWVTETDDYHGLADGARLRFDSIFDDLGERFRADAVSFVRGGVGGGADEASFGSRLAAPLRWIGRSVEGFFFPSVKR